LAVEEQYYLVFPFLVWMLREESLKRVLWLAIVLSPFLRLFVVWLDLPGATYFLTICRLDVIAMGGLIAMEMQSSRTLLTSDRGKRVVAVCLAACLLAVIGLWLTKSLDFRLARFNLVGLTVVDGTCALAVLYVLINPGGWASTLLSSSLAVATGKISYGLYLYHVPLLLIIAPIIATMCGEGWQRTIITAICSIGATFIVAGLSWRYFELPILRLKRKFGAPDVHAAKPINHAT
jgi:peptidoglycan/LPS O-acetylase OafA/YrhL